MNDLEYFVQWHVTSKCNLDCTHCYENSNIYKELTTKEALCFIDQFVDTLSWWKKTAPIVGALHLSGGEPLLRKDLFEIAQYGANNGLTVRLLSNGTLITCDVVKKLINNRVSSVQVSIDGTPSIHNRVRGINGAFKMTTKGIDELIRGGIHTTISCTLSKLNIKAVPEVIKIALNHKVNGLKFSRLVATGKGEKLKDLLLSRQETKELFDYLYKMHYELKDRLTIFLQDPLFCLCDHNNNDQHIEMQQSITPGGCAIGFSGVCLLPDGTILPCRRLPIPIGNIREDDFRNLWANSDVLNNIRDTKNLKGKCGNCNNKNVCKGCRAIAFANTGDYLSSDPQCWYGTGR